MRTVGLSEQSVELLGSPVLWAGDIVKGLVRARMFLELILTQKCLPAVCVEIFSNGPPFILQIKIKIIHTNLVRNIETGAIQSVAEYVRVHDRLVRISRWGRKHKRFG